MLNKRFGTLLILLVLILSPFSAVNVFSSGNQEDILGEAEALIEQKQYNSALKILTEMLKENPNRIDDVQGLLSRIRMEKENYNDRYEELIDTYGGEDVEAAYPIIKELEELDPNPNEATRISLVLARETAGFVFNNNRWVGIMEEGARLLAAEDYAAAADIYMSGFDLSLDIFRDSGYGNIIVNDILIRAEQMHALTIEFTELYSRMITDEAKIVASFSLRSLDDYLADVSSSYEKLERTAALREELRDTADYFILQEAMIRESAGDDKQVHYLIYMDRLLNGRTTVEDLEGITGSIELYWNRFYKTLAADAVTYAEELFTKAYEEYTAGNFGEAEALLDDVLSCTESGIKTLELGVDYLESDSEFAREGLLSMSMDDIEADLLNIRQEHDAAQTFFTVIEKKRILTSLNQRLAAIDGQDPDYEEAGRLLKEDITTENAELLNLYNDWQSRLNEIGSDSLVEKGLNTARLPFEEYGKMRNEILQSEISLAAMLAGFELKKLDDDYLTAFDEVNKGAELIDGIVEAVSETTGEGAEGEDFTVLYRFPDQAIDRLLAAERLVTELLRGIEDLEAQIRLERDEIRSGSAVRTALSHAASLNENSRDLLAQAEKLGEAAREQIFAAEKLKQEGERRIEDSKLLTQKAQFAAAKDRLEQAAAKFDESLSYLEDAVLRTYRDNEIPRLYDEIQVAENNLVVRQVREYLTAGKASYSEGNFPAAQSVLIKAQSRWANTNVEANPEVEYWLTLTQTALSVTSGRIIAATDPLYAEMNQYLNQAYSDFQDAKKEYDSGNRVEADSLFSRAEQSILFVQQFFPFNEEARVLNLRISQYRDPDRFNEIFSNDFRAARNLITSNPQKAYIDLKDLEAIFPSYAGLQTAITEAEYASGLKVRPPDPQRLVKSTELYTLAYNIVSRNIRSEYSVALTYLDEAISLNPNNNDAIKLKDRISTDVGGTAVAVMSNADQQKYDEAVSEFTSGNYLKARILIENLLKNPVNQRNPKIIDLKERIERTR